MHPANRVTVPDAPFTPEARSVRPGLSRDSVPLRWGLVFLLLLCSGCAAAKQLAVYPSARINAAEFSGLSLTGVDFELGLEVENPYTVSLPVVGIDYYLSTEGSRFLEGTLQGERAIPAKQTEQIPLTVRIPFLELYNAIEGARSKSQIPYQADVVLRVRAPVLGVIELPLEESGTLPLPSF